jgi:hypothetical protein
MSKKNKHNNDRDDLKTVRYPIPFPDMNNMDDVGYYPDDLLIDKISRLESERSRLLEMKFDPMKWEVELAYLYREKEIRTFRNEKHDAYMRDLILRGEDEQTFSRNYGPIVSNVDAKKLN